ncbi:MAG: hypothetical protein RL660_2054 [Bacteroidota bacterium]|jgi:gliding motility-associated-like protein
MFRLFLPLLICLFAYEQATAQCGTTISTFPYSEDFEISQGNWTSGGNGNAWAWGTPAKPTINSAGSGTKCWVTDGLTGTGYSSCERSYVLSPCFDFTNLNAPVIALKIFWECEFQFDGATLQYTTNGGTNWVNVGAFGDTNDCNTENWFNYGNITHLGTSGGCTTPLATVKHGWCGRIGNTVGSCQGGNGSGGWVLAKHCIKNLAGQSSVQFRFAFGAGSSCNAYDGVAFDSVAIYEASPISVGLKAICTGNGQLQFSDTASTSCTKTYAWNFGDPGSGAANTSALSNPNHVFTSGTYTVTATVTSPCIGSNTYTLVVQAPQITSTATAAACANSASGSISTASTGFALPSTYTITPSGATNTNGIFSSLLAGNYTIAASDANGCISSTTASIAAGASVDLTILPTSSSNICISGTGLISASAMPANSYTFTLLPTLATNTFGVFTGLNAANYTVVAVNALGCADTTNFQITGGYNLAITSVLRTSPSCTYLQDGQLSLNASGGTAPLYYNLMPVNTTNTTGTYTGLAAGSYTITVTDVNGCTITSVTQIIPPTALDISNAVIASPACEGSSGGALTITPQGGTGAIQAFLQPGNLPSTNYQWSNLSAGTYTISLQDANNCIYDSVINFLPVSNAIVLNVTTKATGCDDLANTGMATLNISGGIPPYNVQWFTNPPSILDTAKNLLTGTYTVQVTDGVLCTATASFFIAQGQCCKDLRLANAFSPNDDFLNDRFGLNPKVPLTLLNLSVYNRWGEQVFETSQKEATWDGYYKGAACDQDTYFIIVRYICPIDQKEYIHKQDLFLVR